MDFEKVFFVPLKKIPTVTHQDKIITNKNGRTMIFDSAKLSDTKEMLKSKLTEFVPERKFKAPILVEIYWCYPLVKGKVKGQYKTTKPDVDNLTKTLLDCMTKVGFWEDDSHIGSLVTTKRYNDLPGIFIRVMEL